MRIISESVLMLFAIVKINPFLSKLHLAKVGAFLRHSVDSIHCALQYHRRTLRPHLNPKHNRAYQQRYGTASTWSKIDYGSKIGERPSGRKTTTVKLDNTLMRAVDGRLLIAQGDVVYV